MEVGISIFPSQTTSLGRHTQRRISPVASGPEIPDAYPIRVPLLDDNKSMLTRKDAYKAADVGDVIKLIAKKTQ